MLVEGIIKLAETLGPWPTVALIVLCTCAVIGGLVYLLGR